MIQKSKSLKYEPSSNPLLISYLGFRLHKLDPLELSKDQPGFGFGVQGLVFRVQGSGFRVQGSGFRVQGSGCRV